jgi:hypothetical protein
MRIEVSKYRCGKHGTYTPDFERVIEEHECPRILCQECELASFNADLKTRPRNVPYFYEDELKVILQEAHLGSAVWRFNPPVIYPEWSFAEDLSPVIPEGAMTSEEIMEKMEALLPEVERLAQENRASIPDPRDLLIMPGRNLRVGDES